MRILSNVNILGTLDLDNVQNAAADTDRFLVQDANGVVKFRTGAEVASDIGASVGFVSTVKHEVKLGEAIAKGQAVYVTSSDGTNMIVSKASNATDVTSSKTLGLLETGGAANAKVFVITEGLLAGLDTSTATAGAPVWLGTDGNLLYGLAAKPVAPAHMVFIGIVTRVNANNGEIFVKVQNGFELEELHNVLITGTPVDKAVIQYDTASGLWKNSALGGVTGTGVSGQVAFWDSANTQTGSNNLFWDATNNRLGIGTTSPSGRLDVFSTSNTYANISTNLNFGSAVLSFYNSVGNGDGAAIGYNVAMRFGTITGLNAAGWTERARITSGGNFIINNASTDNGLRFQVTGDGYFSGSVGIGSTTLTAISLRVSKNLTGAGSSIGIVQDGQIQTDVTSAATGFRNLLNTAASTTLGDYYHIRLGQGTIGAGTTLTQHIGLYINDFANGTSRYGILSELSAGTGKWNLYMGGTAANFLAGNLSIGTANTTHALDIQPSGGTPTFRIARNGGTDFRISSSITATGAVIGTYTSSPILFYTNSASAMTLDASGNLGLGVTPSAWTSTRAIQVGLSGSIANRSGGNGFYMSSNLYFSADPSNTAANGVYINSDFATTYLQANGAHRWFNAPSGTAGNAITFTQAMTLDAIGRLGIGTSAPQSKTHVAFQADFDGIRLQNSVRGHNYLFTTAGVNAEFFSIYDVDNSQYLYQAGSTGQGFLTGGITRMAINSNGNVGIGTTSQITKLTIGSYVGARLPYINGTTNTFDTNGITVTSSNTANANIGGGIDLTNNVHSIGSFSPLITFSALSQSGAFNNNYAAIYGVLAGDSGDGNWNSGHLVFATALAYGASEKMRITNAGNVGIGTTSPSEKLHVVGNIRVTGAYYDSNNSAGTVGQVLSSTATGTDWVSLSEITGVDGTGTANYIAKWLDANTITNSLLFDNGTNVGIGTTSPTAKLHSLSTTSAYAIIAENTISSGSDQNFIQFRAGATIGDINRPLGTNDVKFNINYGALIFGTDTSGTPAERMRLTGNGKLLVGGTNNPGNQIIAYQNSVFNGENSYAIAAANGSSTGKKIMLGYDGTLDVGLLAAVDTGVGWKNIYIPYASLGIGTASPDAKLHVNGTTNGNILVVTGPNTGANTIHVTVPSGASEGLKLTYNANDGSSDINNVFNAPLYFKTNNTTRLTITGTGAATFSSSVYATSFYTSGFVVPTSAVAVFNNSNYGGPAWNNASFVTGNGATGVMMGGDTASYTYGWIQGVQTDTGTAKNLSINPLGGAVGIGTTSPAVLLHLQSSLTGTTTFSNILQTWRTAASGRDISLQFSDGTNQAYIGSISGGLYFGTNGPNERMRITAAGLVGIGTTSPSSKLTIYDAASAPTLKIQDGGTTPVTRSNASNIVFTGVVNPGSDNNVENKYSIEIRPGNITANTDFVIKDLKSNTDRITILQNGNVGIGTATPTNGALVVYNTSGNTLSLQKSGGAASLALGNDTTNYALMESISGGGVRWYTGNGTLSEKMRITADGNIGIGMSTPDTTFSTIAKGMIINGGATGSTYLLFQNSTTGTAFSDGAVVGINASRELFLWNNEAAITSLGTNGVERLRISLDGRVMIGTSSNSTYRLDVNGTVRMNNAVLIGGIATLSNLAGADTRIVVADASGNLSTQPTSTYLSSLSGEATNSGNVVTLTNSAVIGKVLTGLNVTSAAITASDSILTAFGKIQGQIDGLQGGTVYKGSWNASTNTPTITSGTGTQGHYYVVTTAGTTTVDGISSWAVGDWIIFNGTVWEKIPNVDSITSVNGQTGVVSLTTSNISEGTNLYYTDARARAAISLTVSGSSGSATYSSGVLNIPTYTLVGLGGAAAATTITINGVAQDLSANRTFSVGTITSIVAGSYLTGGTITTSGTIAVDATTTNTGNKIVARDASGNFAAGTITANLTGTASLASQVSINYNNNSDASYQMLWGSGNSVYGTAGITCNPFTDSMVLTGTLFSGGLTVTGFGRMYGGDFWHSGTANNGSRTPTIKLGRFSDSENPAYTIYTDDSGGDILEFYSERFTGDFRLTRNSETGLRNMMRVNSDNGGTSLDLYTGGGSTLGVKLQSNGDARFAYDVVAYYSFSDAILKTNVATIENPLQKVMAMRGVTYEWKEGYKAGKKEIGLIAQEVMEIIPEVVSEKERVDGSKFLSVDYEHLTGLLIEAVKELKKEVDELKSK